MSERPTVPIILVTGSRTGLGDRIARAYVEKGYQVIGCGRHPDSKEFPNYEYHLCDLTREESVKELFAKIKEKYRQLDVLVNNLGISSERIVLMGKGEEIDMVFKTNFMASAFASREACKIMMKKHQGRIINISSVQVPLGLEGTAYYGASKSALEHFAGVLAKEVFKLGITVNTLSLSAVKGTGMSQQISSQALSAILKKTISQNEIDIDEVIHSLDFFIAQGARNITNQILYLGGV